MRDLSDQWETVGPDREVAAQLMDAVQEVMKRAAHVIDQTYGPL